MICEGVQCEAMTCSPGTSRSKQYALPFSQVGFGSGFKCNSAVWKATRRIHDQRHSAWAHMKGANLERCWRYVQVPYFMHI